MRYRNNGGTVRSHHQGPWLWLALLLLALLLPVLLLPAQADEPQLLGRWKSDRQRTMDFARKHALLEAKTVRFLEQLMGHLVLTFKPGMVTSDMPAIEVLSASGKHSRFTAYTNHDAYTVLGKTDTQIALSSIDPYTKRPFITIYNFESKDVMWVYTANPLMPDLHLREYFVRLP
ncbi:hypothetical protein [Leeia aquatica]|uniref:Uncharacterized protein n=1 Tax=Leeia aquatica TaxID=2725557 RepID=A0A847RSQ4_9NEIS|nr:hypothetical protein [Leeia aquatica]NLR74240.1 hypothetical protein [Leeia aquatica]